EALIEATAAIEKARREHRKIALLSIGDRNTSMHSKQRSRAAEWSKKTAALVRAGAAGHAVVVENAIQRGALTAILWLADYPVPIRAFTDEVEAEGWVRAQLPTSTVESRVR